MKFSIVSSALSKNHLLSFFTGIATVGCMLVAVGAFGLCLYFFINSMLSFSYTPDLSWMLSTGDWILSHHRIPKTDIFSWTHNHSFWVVYQWLFEIIVASLRGEIGELAMLRLFIVAVVWLYAGLPIWLDGRRKIPLFYTLLISGICLLILPINLSLRPMVVTALFLGLQFMWLQAWRRGHLSTRLLGIWLAVMYILWGNLHTGVVFGPLSLILFALGDGCERLGVYRFSPANPLMEGQPKSFKFYLGWIFLALLASCINPYGIGLYTYFFQLSGQHFLNEVIVELHSPNYHWLSFRLYLLLMSFWLLLMPEARKVFAAFEILHLIIFGFMTFCVLRVVVWMCLYFILILPKAIAQSVSLQPLDESTEKLVNGFSKLRPVLLALMLIGGVSFVFTPKYFPKPKLGQCERYRKPFDFYYQHVARNKKLYNDPELGSCLIGAYPDQKVYIDTRFDFYSENHLRHTRRVSFAKPGWEQILKKEKIDTILIHQHWPVVKLLRIDNGYNILFEDKQVILFERVNPNINKN